jgi:hypothetical protein
MNKDLIPMTSTEGVYILIIGKDDSLIFMHFLIQFDNNHIPTDEQIEYQVKRAVFLPEQMPVKNWRMMTFEEAEQMLDMQTNPYCRKFRNAWEWKDGKVVVNMERAKEIHKLHLRYDRASIMPNLDGEYIRALEDKDKTKQDEVVKRKKKLRDMPDDPRIENAKTPEELAKLTIDEYV